ncbi:MAG TPA: PPOX class F420-dependent oxidoreductase [Dehalococcoidia bacterium]|nr:PPOX class F420-dependent oxidoreductase [Dehalococcoidia bacterium]
MGITLNEAAVQLLTEDKNIAHIATIMPDGSPQVTPVWIDYDGTHILVNTATGRVKWRNLQRNPNVALSVVGSQNAYKAISIRGRVVEMTEDGANDHIDKLSLKYLGKPKYEGHRPGERRVLVRIEPLKLASRI